MCDTMAATGTATASGGTVFAKNSDRERNEAQFLELRPRRRHGRGAIVRATYIAIPQAAETHAVLLSRPFWIWGAEMGANEHGVAIGNEAVHPRLAPQRRAGLIGMDLLRLGLERGASAAEAVSVITTLLEAHGQGGSCGHMSKRYYHNSFIVADARDVFVLETVGRDWAVQRVADATRAISNAYTIGTDITAASAGLRDSLHAQGWWNGQEPLDFADAVTDPDAPGLPGAKGRCARSSGRLAALAPGGADAAAMMAILRDHGRDHGGGAAGEAWHPEDIEGATICMHAADHARRGQSVGSLVSDLRAPDGTTPGAIHWVTGTSAPCTGVFKPVFFDAGLPDLSPPDLGIRPGDRYDPETLWWRHEELHRALLRDGPWPGAAPVFAAERDALERSFVDRATAALHADAATRRAVTEACWREAAEAEAGWLRAVAARNEPSSRRPSYLRAWDRFDRLACMPA